ncbi:hypothetical protein JCGZ_14710 [Jatropha curcas]|uniref:Trichome birefringence-like N-terminal domain-containing protein n=1 Tax=Jatropha curcas TaxID=180498 RepID=A0A067K8R4_JATCU|nr:hypothetical protein JCGZ_14710 [Jatropha curcas]
MIQPTLDRRVQYLFPLALTSILVLGISRLVLDNLKSNHSYIFRLYNGRQEHNKRAVFVLPKDRFKESCNVFEGQWVWDNVSHPLYREESCPYLVKQTTCLRNGRPDSFYQNWRWKPEKCNLPRY